VFSQIIKAFSIPWQRTLYIMFFAQLITAIGFSSIFPFLPFYVKELGTNTNLSIELLVGLVYSGQSLVMMIASPFWGALADRYGRKLMVERAMFGGAIILLLMAFVRSAEELVILRAIQGAITGSVAASSALIAAMAPRERTGYAMGLLQVGLGAGIALGPLIGGTVADAFGYSVSFFVTSALLLIAGTIVLFGVKEEFTPMETQSGERISFLSEWQKILSAPGILSTYSLRFMSQLGRMMIIPIAPLFIQVLLVDTSRLNTFTGLVIGIGSATTTVSAVFLGRLGDRIGQRRIVITSALAAAGLVGVAMGGIIPAISALLARFAQVGEEGAVYGLDNSISAASRAVAPMLGTAVAIWFGLRTTFAATALLFLLTGLFAVWRLPKVQGVESSSMQHPT
jgi:DHA1 family multidrug resistance protein-like MFS transporter